MWTILLFQVCLLTIYNHEAFAIIISPCKVQNLVTQPAFGTSLRTKSLVQIVQMPPVFVQNVMIGICESRNQNVSTGRTGEFYSCEQRYSVVDVYIAESSDLSVSPNVPLTPDYYNSIRFVRESVIIESGCDFTFNLLPLIASVQGQGQPDAPTGGQGIPPQQKMFLRSPYHSNPTAPIRGQPQQPSSQYGNPMTGHYQQSTSNPIPGYPPVGTKGRSGEDEDVDSDSISKTDDEELEEVL